MFGFLSNDSGPIPELILSPSSDFGSVPAAAASTAEAPRRSAGSLIVSGAAARRQDSTADGAGRIPAAVGPVFGNRVAVYGAK